MNSKVIEYLRKQGYNPYDGFYSKINSWINLWKGKTNFHKYKVVYDNRTYEKEMYSLGMPKRIAEDWASICWNEKDQITTTEKNKDYLTKQLEKLKFNKNLSTGIEKSAFSGTCACINRVKNAKLVGTQLVADKFTEYDQVWVNASQIIPLKIEHGKIIDCAFVSEIRIENKINYYIEIHELVKRKDKHNEEYKSYRIKNIYIDEEGKEIEKNNVLKMYYTNSDIPLFSILVPPIENPISESNGLGFSIYGNAIDQIYAADIAFHNFVMDFYLGGKKVFYNKKLTYRDEQGNVVYPDDVSKQQFQIVGDPVENVNDQGEIKEYNPELRVDENKNGIQFFLDLLSFKCGLGTKYYQFNSGGSIVTATQYLGERADLTINARKYRENVDEFVENICRGILLLGRILFKEKVNENDKIEVINTDGFLISEEDLKEQYQSEIAAGLRQPWEYRMKFFGEDETTAKKMIEDEEISKQDEE